MAALPIGKPSHGSAERAFVSISNNADCGGMIILVVEDEFIVREDIASYLRHADWVVIEADSGSRAVAMCGSTDTPVDVLFTDIQLNDSVSGWEVAEAFRAARGNLPVIYTYHLATRSFLASMSRATPPTSSATRMQRAAARRSSAPPRPRP
jgi:CheY-like chemotaxis protein